MIRNLSSMLVCMAVCSFVPASDPLNPWTAVNEGLTGTDVWSMAVSPAGLLFAGTSEGLFRSKDKGDTWEAVGEGLEATGITALTVDDIGIVYAGTRDSGVFVSEDDGETWTAANEGLDNLNIGVLATVVLDERADVYAGAFLGNIFQSLDEGETWTVVLDVELANPFVPSLAVSSEGVLFSGSDDGVYRSDTDGVEWQQVNEGLGNLFIESLVISRDVVLFAGTDGGVFRSLDLGDTWEPVNDENLGDRNVRTLVVNQSFALFAGTHEGGVLRSLNHGETWEPVNEGLTTPDVSSLVIDADGTMYAGTHGGGVFRRDAATDVSAEDPPSLPAGVVLSGNYPNPFARSTRIRYALPAQERVTLTVFDAAGRVVAVLVDRQQAAGWHEVDFAPVSLPSGIYFYRLEAGSAVKGGRMVLLR